MNTRRTLSGPRVLAAVGAAAALLLAGCGGGDEGAQQAGGDSPGAGEQQGSGDTAGGDNQSSAAGKVDLTQIGLVNQPEEVDEPVKGGTLEFGVYAMVSNLDPSKATGTGTTGGTALTAVYDALIRYNPTTREYEPQLAKSMEPNSDASVWTMTLREGVTFSDGTPLNAEAVMWSIDHYKENRGGLASVLEESIASIETPDAHTLVFTLTEPWTELPFVFTYGPGYVLAPSSVQGGDFTPIGAGAFTVENFAPQEELVLAARAGYWDGRPPLDELRFVPLQGPQAKIDSLRSGGIDVAFLRDEVVIVAALEQGMPGFLNVQNLGGVNLINSGAQGQTDRPGTNPKIRQAIAYAVDPDVVSQRTAEGKGLFSKKLFQEWSRWTTEADPTPYDPEKARQLLNEVKQETGYDGSISYSCYTTPEGKARALVMQQLLGAVGFDVSLDLAPNVGALIQKVIIDGDFDMGCWGFNVPEAAPWIALEKNLGSDSSRNTTGFGNAEMDALFHELKTAPDDETRGEVLNEIQQLWTEVVPVVVDSATPEFLAWTDQVHGITLSAKTIALLDDAWIE